MTPLSAYGTGTEAVDKVCGVPMAMLQEKSWAPHSSTRSAVNAGTTSGPPFPSIVQIEDGQARRQPIALGWGGVLVVVGGQESWPQGEGQRVRSSGTGMSGSRR
jgi:hypothetical protein